MGLFVSWTGLAIIEGWVCIFSAFKGRDSGFALNLPYGTHLWTGFWLGIVAGMI